MAHDFAVPPKKCKGVVVAAAAAAVALVVVALVLDLDLDLVLVLVLVQQHVVHVAHVVRDALVDVAQTVVVEAVSLKTFAMLLI